MKIKPIELKVYSTEQTQEEKNEIFRKKINEIVEELKKLSK